MTMMSAFALPERLEGKSDPALIAGDERHFAAIEESLARSITDLSARLAQTRPLTGGAGQQAMDRDLEIHRLSAQLRTLGRFRLDACLGRIVPDDGSAPLYIGRFGLADAAGRQLLVDWRAPAAEPFFAATLRDPMGLSSRRRYRWTAGRVSDYWDETFTPGAMTGAVAPDDQSAFLASLGASRSPRMRDVLATIQADQDAVIRASSRGALVVDGGPGTGKTVVALHRAAYLVYSDPRLAQRQGGVLVVGPHQPYLAYVDDVLPSLGENSVQLCTLSDFVPQAAAATPETSAAVAELKATRALVDAIEPAVRLYEEPPAVSLVVETPWLDIEVTPGDWAAAFDAADTALPHNTARDQVWDELIDLLLEQADGEEVPLTQMRRVIASDHALRRTFAKAWPILDPEVVVSDLWSVPAYLRRCAPTLDPEQVQLLQRADPRAWTTADLPLLDAARFRIGDPAEPKERRRREARAAAEQAERDRVIDELIAADPDGEGLMTMLRGEDVQHSLAGDDRVRRSAVDQLAGPFAHIVIDEAQELTDAEWAMLLRRCPSRSFTIVGDRAQARHGFSETWEERLRRVGISRIGVASLRVNYRTPEEIMTEAAPIIRAAIPDANVPESIRRSGHPVVHRPTPDLRPILDEWLRTHPEGIACVIGEPAFVDEPRVRSLTPESAKGLEFDLVVLVNPEGFGDDITGAVDRYVAMTRATERLVVLRDAR